MMKYATCAIAVAVIGKLYINHWQKVSRWSEIRQEMNSHNYQERAMKWESREQDRQIAYYQRPWSRLFESPPQVQYDGLYN